MNDTREEEKTKSKKKFNWGRLWFWIISIVVIVILIPIFFPGLIEFDEGERLWYWIVSIIVIVIFIATLVPRLIKLNKDTRQLRACQKNLMNLGIVVTNYSTIYRGLYPPNLEVLIEEELIDELPVCPVSGDSYLYDIAAWNSVDFAIRCPNPDKHEIPGKRKDKNKYLCYKSRIGIKGYY